MKPRLAISACLLGHAVRYDGGNKRLAGLSELLASWAEILPICPEMEAGLGVPRQPIHWALVANRPRLLREDGIDISSQVEGWLKRNLLADWDGLVLKARSPSCSPGPLPLFGSAAANATLPMGLVATQLRHLDFAWPLIDEDGWNQKEERQTFLLASAARASRRLGSPITPPALC
jgi:uncharacterized protein YbbK (DUF523 family)